MKDQNKKTIGTREKDDALMNFMVRQAQEAILNPKLPEADKDVALEAAIETIQKVAERKAVYHANYGEGRRTRRPHIIYEAPNTDEEEQQNIPSIIAELNENLNKDVPENLKRFTIERISEGIGISKRILYEWAESDSEFSAALERLKDVQKDDSLKTGTEEDYFVNSMMIALLLMETRDRHYKQGNF